MKKQKKYQKPVLKKLGKLKTLTSGTPESGSGDMFLAITKDENKISL